MNSCGIARFPCDSTASDCLSTVAALCEQADERLFRALKYNPIHPPSSTATTYHLSAVHHTSPVPVHTTTSSSPKSPALTSVILSSAYYTKIVFSFLAFSFSLCIVFNSGMSVNVLIKSLKTIVCIIVYFILLLYLRRATC